MIHIMIISLFFFYSMKSTRVIDRYLTIVEIFFSRHFDMEQTKRHRDNSDNDNNNNKRQKSPSKSNTLFLNLYYLFSF